MVGALCSVILDLWPQDFSESGWTPSLRLLTVPEHLGSCQLSPQKDSHTLYLEQELESLKVVLDIKNKQLHMQEKKMMAIATLVRPEADGHDCLASKRATLQWVIHVLFLSMFSRPRKMWSWMKALRRSSRRMRTSKPEWKNIIHCQGKSSLYEHQTFHWESWKCAEKHEQEYKIQVLWFDFEAASRGFLTRCVVASQAAVDGAGGAARVPPEGDHGEQASVHGERGADMEAAKWRPQ